MKNALFVLSLFWCCIASAQKKVSEYGVQGGLNLNTLYGSSFDKNIKGSTTGLSIGANAKWNKTNRFGIRLQLSYEQMGYALRNLYVEDSVNGLAKTDLRLRLNYLTLPVIAEFVFGKKVKFRIDAGGFAGVLLSSKAVVDRVLPNGNRSFWYSFTSTSYQRLNAGLAVGAGVQIPLTSKIAIDIDARNYTGLTNVSKSSSGYSLSRKTMTFSFLTGLSFQL